MKQKIIEMLQKGMSQSAISKDLGVPRSMVQSVSDKELGVDPASLKSLTTEQIIQIQKDSSEGGNNTFLAKVHGVSAKVIARALLVRITEHANNVQVISPIEAIDENGEFEKDMVLEVGGFASLKGEEEPTIWYLGAFIESSGHFLGISNIKGSVEDEDEEVYKTLLLKPEEIEATDVEHTSLFNAETLFACSQICAALTDKGHKLHVGMSIFYKTGDGLRYPLRGCLDVRRRVGYFDAASNRTIRSTVNNASFSVDYNEELEEAEAPTESTKEKLGELDLFLMKHHILVLPESVVITINGKPETITTSHQSYQAVVQAIKDQDIQRAYDLMKPREMVAKYSSGRVRIDGKKVLWDDNDISNTSISKRLLTLAMNGDDKNLTRLAKFMDKMYQNPSATLVQSGRIYEFMAYSDIEIDDDGDIILYKSVKGNYMDKRTGTISNVPGTIVRMARSFVNDNNSELCSYGLHVCSLAYLRQCFGSNGQRVVRCKLNPKDIVSITNDFKSSKIRCCEYLVMDDYTAEYNKQYKSIDMTGLYS